MLVSIICKKKIRRKTTVVMGLKGLSQIDELNPKEMSFHNFKVFMNSCYVSYFVLIVCIL